VLRSHIVNRTCEVNPGSVLSVTGHQEFDVISSWLCVCLMSS